jgi:thiol-disulfide isomerase/thioredoxin
MTTVSTVGRFGLLFATLPSAAEKVASNAMVFVKSLALLAAVLMATAGGSAQASDRWLTSYEAAMETARETGRPVLTIFTGSDWCPHCRTLEDNVLASDAFLAWSEGRVVLLMIDLPQHGISQAVRSERSQVCIKYGVRTFPSALLIGPDGQKIALQTGYSGVPADTWIAHFDGHVPAQPQPDRTSVSKVLPSLDKAVETAKTAKRPILLLVSKSGDSAASSRVASLMNDPEFDALARENFVVASVPPADESGSQTDQTMEQLLGGVDLAPEAVELIVTDDGQTPLFSQSAAQPPQRIVSGLRRFLAARQSARTVSQRR